MIAEAGTVLEDGAATVLDDKDPALGNAEAVLEVGSPSLIPLLLLLLFWLSLSTTANVSFVTGMAEVAVVLLVVGVTARLLGMGASTEPPPDVETGVIAGRTAGLLVMIRFRTVDDDFLFVVESPAGSEDCDTDRFRFFLGTVPLRALPPGALAVVVLAVDPEVVVVVIVAVVVVRG